MTTRPPSIGRNPLQEAFDNYNQVTEELAQEKFENQELRATNQALVAEVTMLRSAYREADAERIRLTQVASTLHGSLKGIRATINDAVATAVADGIEAAKRYDEQQPPVIDDDSLQHAGDGDGDNVEDILQRLAKVAEPTDAGESRVRIEHSPEQQPRPGTNLPVNQL